MAYSGYLEENAAADLVALRREEAREKGKHLKSNMVVENPANGYLI